MKTTWKQTFLTILIISIAGIVIYSNAINSPFHFDDEAYIRDNPSIHSLSNVKQMWHAMGKPSRFIGLFSFAIDYRIHQVDPAGYHVTNIIIHIVNALLVWKMALLIFLTPRLSSDSLSHQRNTIALSTALLFLSHPLQTQAVTYLSQRFASLATMFYLATIVLYLLGRLTRGSRRVLCFILASFFAVLGMFTKEITFTLPLMILLTEYSFFSYEKEKRKVSLKYIVGILLTMLIIPIALKFDMQSIFTQRPSHSHVGDMIIPWNYFLTQLVVIVRYIQLLVFPVGQNFDYDFPVINTLLNFKLILSTLIIIGVIFLALRLRKKNILIAFGLFWFFITLLVESSIIPIRHVIFEHRVYLPSVGFAFACSVALYRFLKNSQRFLVAMCVIVATLGYLSYQRNIVWQDEIAFWSDVKEKAPKKTRAYFLLGYYSGLRGLSDTAMDYYNEAIELDPQYSQALTNRGLLKLDEGDKEGALKDLNLAVDADASNANVYYNRALILSQSGQRDRALLDYSKAIELNPQNHKAYNNRGNLLRGAGKVVESITDYSHAININPQYAESYNNRGLAYLNTKQHDLAMSDFNAAIKFNPEYAAAYNNRGMLYSLKSEFARAVLDFSKALSYNSNYKEVYYNRGNVFLNLKQYEKAIADYTQTLKLSPNFTKAYNNRGVAYLYQNKHTEAIKNFSQAIGLAPGFGDSYYNRSLAYKALGKINEAIVDVKKAESLNYPVDPKLLKELMRLKESKL